MNEAQSSLLSFKENEREYSLTAFLVATLKGLQFQNLQFCVFSSKKSRIIFPFISE